MARPLRSTSRKRQGATSLSDSEVDAAVLTATLYSLILSGQLDTRGKTLKVIESEFRKAAGRIRKFTTYTRHVDGLGESAENAYNSGNFGLAVALWATLVEHEVNHLFSFAPGLVGYHRTLIASVVKDSGSIRNKLTLIHAFFGAPPPPKDVLGAIQNISDNRNQYLHYKWAVAHNADAEANEERSFKEACGKYHLVKKYLKTIEIKYFMGGFNGRFVPTKSGKFRLRRTSS